MIPIPMGNYMTYVVGAALLLCGLMVVFPNTAAKIFKAEIKTGVKQKIGGAYLIVLGVGLLVVGYMGWLF